MRAAFRLLFGRRSSVGPHVEQRSAPVLTTSISMPVTRARSTPAVNATVSDAVKTSKTTDLPDSKTLPAIVTKTPPSDLAIRAFPSAADFESFLHAEHATCPGIYLKFAKKASGIPSITGAEAVEVALCFGWIDGRANSLDDKFWLVRYTPRRAKSIWSQKNVNTVARLIEEGRMRSAGLAAVDAAKAGGRWDRAYAGPATIVVPEDFQAALDAEAAAKAYFGALNKSQRYSVLWRIETASPKARQARIEALVQTLAVGRLPGDRNNGKEEADANRKRAMGGRKKTAESAAKISKPARKVGVKKKA